LLGHLDQIIGEAVVIVQNQNLHGAKI
jgi:hypothetical protein